MTSSIKAARASTAQAQEQEFFLLNAQYRISANAKPDGLLEDTSYFLSCARGILEGFLSNDGGSEALFGVSLLLEMAANTLNATKEFSFAASDEQGGAQ